MGSGSESHLEAWATASTKKLGKDARSCWFPLSSFAVEKLLSWVVEYQMGMYPLNSKFKGDWEEIVEYWHPKPVTLFCPRLCAVASAILAGMMNWPGNTYPKLCPPPLLQKWENKDRQFPSLFCSWGCVWHKILAKEMWAGSSGEASLPLLPFPLLLPWTGGVINGAATAI